MPTRDDVPHGQRLFGSISVTVAQRLDTSTPRRDVELIVTDTDGQALRLIIWSVHDIDVNWVEGRDYTLEGVRGKRYSAQSPPVEVHSTRAFEVTEASGRDPTKLCFLGDTHVGYRHRPDESKPSHARGVDDRAVFETCLERVRAGGFDAVVHTGDVFDHHATQGDDIAIGQEIAKTVDEGIPFYYIIGNHDGTDGEGILSVSPGTHLNTEPTVAGHPGVTLLGVDHAGAQGFPADPPSPTVETLSRPTVLVVHETPYPVVD